MQKWEHLNILLSSGKSGFKKWNVADFTEQLNLYGSQGWELVSIFTTQYSAMGSGGTDAIIATFKRPL